MLSISEITPGARDEQVLQQATAERRVLLTNDKDFATLAFLQRLASAGIVLLRMPRTRSRAKGEQLLTAVAHYGTRLRASMTVIEPHATRRRPLPRSRRPKASK